MGGPSCAPTIHLYDRDLELDDLLRQLPFGTVGSIRPVESDGALEALRSDQIWPLRAC
jgi:hypothetical protein